MSNVVFHAPGCWHRDMDDTHLAGRGDPRWLDDELTAFFASRQCPGSAIRMALEWALLTAREGRPVVGGFHSPLERSVLELLLEACSPTVVVLARDIKAARLPADWKKGVAQGHLTVVSAVTDRRQLSRDRAAARNDLVTALASRIVVAHASPNGNLASQVKEWQHRGIPIQALCSGSADS